MGGAPVDAPAAKDDKAHDDKAHAAHGDAAGEFKAIAGDGKRVFFVEPADGASVKSPVKLVFGVEGVEVKPAGDLTPNSGHHHVIVDTPSLDAGVTVPMDATHIHYGGGQTEAEMELAPGEHTLTMQLADFAHRSYGPGLSATIKITVEE
jgi:hypothetical protein